MTTEIVPMNRIEQALRKENITEQVLAKLRADYLHLTVKGEDDKDGYKIVRDARLHCKELRVLASKIAKAGREEAIKEQRDWIAAEKNVVNQISEVEEHLEKQEEIVAGAEKRKKAEQEERERKAEEERARLLREKVEKRAQSLMKVGVFRSISELETMLDSEFDLLLKDSTEKHDAELKRKADEDARRAEEDKKRAEEQKKLDEQRKAQEAEQKRIDEEKRKIELENARREAAEKAKKEEAERIKREQEEKERKDREAEAEAKRLEELKPDFEKLDKLAYSLVHMDFPVVKCDEAKKRLNDAKALIERAALTLIN